MHNGRVCQMHVLSIFGRDIRHCRLEGPSRFERNICWEVWKMRFWKASSLRPSLCCGATKLGHKDLLRIFFQCNQRRAPYPRYMLFVCCLQGISEDRTAVGLLPESGPCSLPLHVDPCFGQTSGPWVLPYTKTLVFLCPSFHLAILPQP